MHIALQAFSWIDIPLVFLILVIEILLSADNAAALGLIVKKLPEIQRKKALFAGLYSAFVLRAIGVIFTAYLIYLFWMQMIGGIYLIYLAWHFLFGRKKEISALSPTSYWKAVFYIELIDVIFAIDSILGAFALASLYYPFAIIASKLWVIYLGGTLGLVAVRFATGKFLAALDKYKKIEYLAFLLIGWMGIKLIAEGGLSFINDQTIRHVCDIFFWIGTLIIILTGLFFNGFKAIYKRFQKSKFFSLAVFLVLVFSIEIIGGLFTQTSLFKWYSELEKPIWNPPEWIFGPVWTVLYTLIAISGWLIFKSPRSKKKQKALYFYGIQLFFNFLWTFFFFYLQSPLLAFIDISILFVSILVTILLFWKLSKKAAILLAPYFIWVGYALTLNLAIWLLN